MRNKLPARKVEQNLARSRRGSNLLSSPAQKQHTHDHKHDHSHPAQATPEQPKVDLIKKKYEELIAKPSDIQEHLPTLKEYASKCNHITEFGVRTALSTYAILHGKPQNAPLISYDIEPTPGTDELLAITVPNKINRTFIIGDTRRIHIAPTDMLFIDTLHDYDLLKVELAHHADKVKKYIIFHDTTTYGINGETKGKEGINRAIKEFQTSNPERETKKVFTNNNGLTILERQATPTKITVYTAIYGNKDVLKKQPDQTVPVKWVCFTDDPDIQCEPGAKEQWDIRVHHIHQQLHPRLQAKYFRMHPYEFLDTEIVMRMDGSARLLKSKSVEHFVNQMLPASDILTFQHPERNGIEEEAEFCTKLGKPNTINKYKGLPMLEQVESYFKRGFPKQYGLTGTGVLITKKDNPKIRDFFHKRWEENLKRGYMDQLSFEPLIYFEKIKRQRFQEDEWKNSYIDFKSGHKHWL